MSAPVRLRCAIYTRKSTEEGLEQEFNSLDAQREACAAFIASQVGLGWKLVPDRYDDGGISGGTMERPGLQRLLQDIRDKKIDVVVVYKIDRLTRSLTDFAKMVDVFDKASASFVSVTQQFNTTTSMGRLTLNVLLSFAQFEREVTAERIRDKIAASRAKGMWMGGTVPLGYEVRDRKLIPKESEARLVRFLFDRYIGLRSVPKLSAELIAQGVAATTDYDLAGGTDPDRLSRVPLSRSMRPGMLYKLLANPLYIGRVRHRSSVYDGEHEAIVDAKIFNEVQELLANGALMAKGSSVHRDVHLLSGLLFDETGDRMAPSHSTSHGRRYRYYISNRIRAAANKQADTWRVPALEIERIVRDFAINLFRDQGQVASWIELYASAAHVREGLCRIDRLVERLSAGGSTDQQRSAVRIIFRSITLRPTRVHFEVDASAIVASLFANDVPAPREDDPPPDQSIAFEIPISFKRRGNELRRVIDSPYGQRRDPDPAMIELIAKAHLCFNRLTASTGTSVSAVAREFGLDRADVGRILPLAFLSPQMTHEILTGQQGIELTTRGLARNDLPILWADQNQALR